MNNTVLHLRRRQPTGTRRVTAVGVATVVAGAMLTAISSAPTAAAADPPSGAAALTPDGRTTLCGDRYCATLALDDQVRISQLSIDGVEVLDRQEGIFSSVRVGDTTAGSLRPDTPPEVTVSGDTIVVSYRTQFAQETWRVRATAQALQLDLERRWLDDLAVTEQGMPTFAFAENAFEHMRWPGDGGNFPVGGTLLNTFQTSWLAGGSQYADGIRTSKRQTDWTMLNPSTGTGLAVTATSGGAPVDHCCGTEIWRSDEESGHDLNVATVVSASTLHQSAGTPADYGGQTTRDGSPVFKPVTVLTGQVDRIAVRLAPADVDEFYDLGQLNGVDEDALSQVINNYARWMMQDDDKGASTESPQLQSEAPPFEMHWLGQLLELFGDPEAIRSFQTELGDIRDYLMLDNGRMACCTPGGPNTFYGDYGDQATGFVLGIVKAYQLGGDAEWLRSMRTSARSALQYLLENQADPTTHFVRNVVPDLDESGYNNDYWESSSGEFNGYASAMLYEALTDWAEIERGVLHEPERADRLAAAAGTLRRWFNKPVDQGGFWSPQTRTFRYGTGNADALYLPVNAAVLRSGIADRQRRLQITEALREQAMAGNYDLHPMNVRDLYQQGKVAPTAGKGGENGGWYGAPDGDFYAGLPLLDNPQVLQTAIASFLTRYRADGFYGGSTWDRDTMLERTASAQFFPTTAMPAWGLYHYGYGIQPGIDGLTLAPYIAPSMTGTSVDYTWRGNDLTVGYPSQTAFEVTATDPLATPLTVRWLNQTPNRRYVIFVDGRPQIRKADASGSVELTLPQGSTGLHVASCRNCRTPGAADDHGTVDLISHYDHGEAELRNDAYDQVGTQIAVGPRPIRISSLSRFKAPGDRLTHRVKILDANGSIVASTTVDMSRRADRRGFVAGHLHRPVTLPPGVYYLYSSETPGGDRWYDDGGSVQTPPGVTVLGAAHGRDRAVTTGGGGTYGPVGFTFRQVGAPTPWLQEFLESPVTTVRSGGSVTVPITVWGQADRPIDGTVRAGNLPEGWTAEPARFTVPTRGEPASTTATLSINVPDNAATGTVDLDIVADGDGDGLRSSQPLSVAVANMLYGFDDGTTQGWQSQEPTSTPNAVTSMLNGPGTPQRGSHLLQADAGAVGHADPRTLFVEPDEPLDLSNASRVYAYVDSWGVPPYTQDHTATITVYSGDDRIAEQHTFSANVWNRIDVDVSDWEHRSSVTRVEITFTLNIADGASAGAMLDVDSVGFDAG